MPKYNLCIKGTSLSTQKSGNGFIEVPEGITSDFINPILTDVIPQEWQDTIDTMRAQEQQFVRNRQFLMQSYKEQFKLIADKRVAEFVKEHPELLI